MEENIEKDEEENKSFDYRDIVSTIIVYGKEEEFVYEINSNGNLSVSQGRSAISAQVAGEAIVGKDTDLSGYLGSENYFYAHAVLRVVGVICCMVLEH